MPTALGTVASHRTATGGGWTPADLPSKLGWWDADDASTFTYSSGAIVSQWNDKSGANEHLTPLGTAPARTGTQNGRATVVFTGTERLANTSFNLMSGTTLSVALCATVAPTMAAGDRIISFVANAEGYDHLSVEYTAAIYLASSTAVEAYRNGSMSQKAFTVNAPMTVSSIFNGLNHTMYVNGTAGTVVGTTGSWASSTIRIGYTGGTNNFKGQIFEMIVCSGALSTVERQQVESYLTNKWIGAASPIPTTGLALWLDADDATTFSSDGNGVTQWRDKSGGNYHANADIAGLTTQPDRVTNAVNGRAAVLWTGAETLKSTAPSGQKPVTYVTVQQNDGGGLRTLYSGYAQPGSFEVRINGTVADLMAAGAALVGSSTAGSLPVGVSVLAVTNSAAGVWNFYVNGTAAGTGTDNRVYGASDTRIGMHQGGGYAMVGHYAEIIKYDRVLSTVERQQVESYLKSKWGTP